MNKEEFDSDANLRIEAEFIYKFFFSTPLTEEIFQYYIQANKHFIIPKSPLMEDIIQNNRDLEAIEMAYRLKNPQNIITRKIHILIYLAETERANYKLFINNHDKALIGTIFLFTWQGFLSILKCIKGLFLLRKLKCMMS